MRGKWDTKCVWLIVWTDACKNCAWTPFDEAVIDKKSSRIYSVGWVVRETKDLLLIASSIGNAQCCLQMQIPKSTIRKAYKLKE